MKINKQIYRVLLVLSFLLLNALILLGISKILSYLNSGAERTSMLRLGIAEERMHQPLLTWDTLSYEGRPVSMPALQQIEKDYLNAWYTRQIAYQSNDIYGIEDYYTDSARIHLYHLIKRHKIKDIHLESSTLTHRPKLHFFSADGKMVSFTDEKVQRYERIFKNNEVIYASRDTANYRVLMLFEDGFWRIRHLVKQTATHFENNNQKQSSAYKFPFFIKGINYYPQDTPWDTFGDSFNTDVLQKDFEIIKNVGLNTIRVFVPYEDFGKVNVSQIHLKKLYKLLDVAGNQKLKVIITLFDFYGDYSVLNWTLTHRHAQQIVEHCRDHPALLAWDIKNEPDLDFDSRGKQLVLDWLQTMISQIKYFDPEHPVTIGWSSPEAASHLWDEVDFVSWHFYRDIEELVPALRKLTARIGNKPHMLQEFGMSSYRGIWAPFGNSEKAQSQYHEKMQAFFKEEKVPFMSWTLYDFKNIPPGVTGRLPWRRNKQKYFGFIDPNGKKKKAFTHISH
ncbi:glycosyl hydrolase family 5 [Ascidiimonas aurantiaca]|uniref:glycosyl hydrolase family 5 n=1 Tax=Ascidiimonas aurantiaca TaxID=1685432 RepID=UPI0030ECCE1C